MVSIHTFLRSVISWAMKKVLFKRLCCGETLRIGLLIYLAYGNLMHSQPHKKAEILVTANKSFKFEVAAFFLGTI